MSEIVRPTYDGLQSHFAAELEALSNAEMGLRNALGYDDLPDDEESVEILSHAKYMASEVEQCADALGAAIAKHRDAMEQRVVGDDDDV